MTNNMRYKPTMGHKCAGGKRAVTIYILEDEILTLNSVAKAEGKAISRVASEIVSAFLANIQQQK